MTRPLHHDRLEAVLAAVRESGARRVADLGCGGGDLLVRLAAEPGIAQLTGVDVSHDALARLRARLAAAAPRVPVDLVAASLTDAGAALGAVDCAVLVEVIEHLPPGRLSALERAVFDRLAPATVIVTTPNAEFNPLLGVPAHRFRHRDHRFEWTRTQFRA